MLNLVEVAVGELQPVSMEIGAGEIVTVSGPSGSGKSRLLRAVADIDAHQGEVYLNGEDQARMPAHQWRRRVMMVPAESQWWFSRVGDHFPDETPPRWQTLDFSEDPLPWSVNHLSSGERQRLALWRAVAHRPEALLLDEPTANLDDAIRDHVEHWLVECIREHQWPVIWVAHDEGQLSRVADRRFHIHGHRLESLPCR